MVESDRGGQLNKLQARDGLETIRAEPEDYGFTFEAHPARVRIAFGGVTVADSSNVRVMHETRLAPIFYFPRDDLNWDLLQPSEHRTYCPFKGNASYWSLVASDRRSDNAAWSYEDPYEGASHIKDYVAFYADLVQVIDEGEKPVDEGADAPIQIHTNPLLGWLLNEAPLITSSKELTEEFARELQRVGIPVWRLSVIIRTLHPQVAAEALRWWAKRPDVDVLRVPYADLQSPEFLNSPLVPIFEGAGGIRRRLDIPDPVLDFGILEDLHAEGATDYVAMPLTFLDGQINALTLASDRPGGFGTGDLGHVYEVLAQLARLYELHNMRRTAVTLLDTYLGRHAGERVLNGRIKRGDGEHIEAVIWFCDLRESTPLAQSMSQEDFLGALNQFFDCMAGAVLDQGGQVLRFIGDAALAIFPVANSDAAAQARTLALTAAEEAHRRIVEVNEKRANKDWRPLAYGLALHVGDVTYGNIGTRERLEFTVVGESANYAARLESLCKTLGRPILASAAFAQHFPDRFESLGKHDLRGIRDAQEIFALDL
jgi:adenylate cyclase